MTEVIKSSCKTPVAAFVFAHGAGAGMDTDFMAYFAESLDQASVLTCRFEFPYMQTIRATGRRRPPDRADKLLASFHRVIGDVAADVPDLPLFIGGKSMGGRIASMIAAETEQVAILSGLICLGYPFHPPGKSERLRIEHFCDLKVPTLICQGERDAFGGRGLVERLPLPDTVEFNWAPDGNHDLVPRKSTGLSRHDSWTSAAQAVATFVRRTIEDQG